MRDDEDTRLDYASTASYMTAVVQVRFSSAALYMTAAAFLVSAHFSETKWKGHPIVLPILGLVMTISAWILDIRTEALIKNLVERGVSLEHKLTHAGKSAFFEFQTQPQKFGIRIPFLRKRLPNDSALVRYIFSYTFGLELMYGTFLAFWVNAAWIAR